MKLSTAIVLSLIAASDVHALPGGAQTVLGPVGMGYGDVAASLFGGLAKHVQHTVHGWFGGVKESADRWTQDGREFVKQGELTYELVSHPAFGGHQLRMTEPTLCDPAVKQYSGYLDIEDDKHLFFWFFEARNDPENAPLMMWLNGGPGCSSSTGLLFELGPCSIANEGLNTTHNPHSWTKHANVIFLDQPVNVGYSYSKSKTVNTSPVAGKDVHAFMELFLTRFPQYSKLPFHIAAESYGGTYGPNIASVIHKENKALAIAHANTDVVDATLSSLLHVNLASVILGNGLTDPYTQMASIPDYVCDGPYPIYDDPKGPQCEALRTKVPTCQRLIKSCYDYNSRFTCVPAILYCNSQLMGPLMQTGLNPYDVRKSCDRQKDGSLCYRQMNWIETWMNDPAHKKALGVDPSLTFESCNMNVNQAFVSQGDGAHDSAKLLPELIEDGVRLLVYAGNADMMCNYMGNERWVENLETVFQEEFVSAASIPWIVLENGKKAGTVRTAGGEGFSAGNITFVNVHEAGHMVPYDQPEAGADMISRWIMDISLTSNQGV